MDRSPLKTSEVASRTRGGELLRELGGGRPLGGVVLAAIPHKAFHWVAQLERQVKTEGKGKEGNSDAKDEGEDVGDDGDRQQQQQQDNSWDGPQYTVHTGWKCNSASEAIVVERACSVREFIYMLVDTHPGYESCRCKFQERELVNGLRGVNGI